MEKSKDHLSDRPTSEIDLISQLQELINAWQKEQSARAEGGLVSLSGFEFQFLLVLLNIVRRWKKSSEAERQHTDTAHAILTEAISDITESGECITLTQVKRTLSEKAVSDALKELWEIFNLASKHTPDLLPHLRFKISGKNPGTYEGKRDPHAVIYGWGNRSKNKDPQELVTFKTLVSCERVPDPREELTTELENLSRDEDTQTTIGRWLGYLLQIGSGICPEQISALIWRELRQDKSLEAFRATLARLLSQSRFRLNAVQHTFGSSLSLPRTNTLLHLQESVLTNSLTLLIGPSGSGKSALCKVGIQTIFKESYNCLFLHQSDIISFTEASSSSSSRDTRRLDELLVAQVIEKPVIIIDDVDDINTEKFDSILNLIQNALSSEISKDVRFVLVAHLDAERSVYDKIATRFGAESPIATVKLPQLPIKELQSSTAIPSEVVSLLQRAEEFGPALNLKLLDWLIGSVQRDGIDTSSFQNDLDLLDWFWRVHIGDGYEDNEPSRLLINTALLLAEKFTPDLPLNKCGGDAATRVKLIRQDCLRVAEGRVTVTHRFVGDCARFRDLLENRRELEISDLSTRLRNPLWSQPIRWFSLYLALKSEESEIWQELLEESLKGNHLQLIDLLLDGAILSRKGNSILQNCASQHLPFVIERLISRMLAIATSASPILDQFMRGMPASSKLLSYETITGIPKAEQWEPIWRWLISQDRKAVLQQSGVIFKAAEAWLNWGNLEESFPIRVEVANFILDLAQQELLPEPDPEEGVISIDDLDKLIELRQQGILPYPEMNQRYSLGDFSSNAFACIVFSLKLLPERAAWLLRALAGRISIPATRLKPTQTSIVFGTGVLEPPHPKGPSEQVNDQFRNFMLKRDGAYLSCVVRVNPELGAELLLALTIAPPGYRYDSDPDSDLFDKNLGTIGSDDIDSCTFKFYPLLFLLNMDEVLAVDVVATLCNVATIYWHEHCWSKNKLEGNIETDTDGITLLIAQNSKYFKGGRHALYWHRQYPWVPKIVACLLMTLENWLYSRPIRVALEHSISIVLDRAETVAMLGVLISIAKCDPHLLENVLRPLLSSLQLLRWLELEQLDQGQDYALDFSYDWRKLSENEYEELFRFHKLSHRKTNLLEVALRLVLQQKIPANIISIILEDWDNYQINLIPPASQYRALKIRAWFDPNNYVREEDEQGKQILLFVATLPENPEIDAQAELARGNLQYYDIIITCRKILNGELVKNIEIQEDLLSFLTNEELVSDLKQQLDSKQITDLCWAIVAALLEDFNDDMDELCSELKNEINSCSNLFLNLPTSLDYISRCQIFDIDAVAFIAHVAPKLLREYDSDRTLRASVFRCLLSVRNCTTSAFMRSWIREYGFADRLMLDIINVLPRIARLLFLTNALVYTHLLKKDTNAGEGGYIVPRPELISEEIRKRKNILLEEAWSSLQREFEEKIIPQASIIEVLEWTPEILNEAVQQIPDGMNYGCDWDFLAAALIPLLDAKPNSETDLQLVMSVEEQFLSALLNERKEIYVRHEAANKKNLNGRFNSAIDSSQARILDKIVIFNCFQFNHFTKPIIQFNHFTKPIIQFFKKNNVVDCIVLGHVLDTLIHYNAENSVSNRGSNSFKKDSAFAVGEYLFELRHQNESDLYIIGKIREVWKKLLNLLSCFAQEAGESVNQADEWLETFFKRFQEVLLSDGSIKRKLYRIGISPNFSRFRRILFIALLQDKELLPSIKNEESEHLVQVLAELWSTDSVWIKERQARLLGMKTILEPLQEIDAVGARRLGDLIANSLANPSN